MSKVTDEMLADVVAAVVTNTGFPLTLTTGELYWVASVSGEIVAEGKCPRDTILQLRTWERGWAMARRYRHEGKHGTGLPPIGVDGV